MKLSSSNRVAGFLVVVVAAAVAITVKRYVTEPPRIEHSAEAVAARQATAREVQTELSRTIAGAKDSTYVRVTALESPDEMPTLSINVYPSASVELSDSQIRGQITTILRGFDADGRTPNVVSNGFVFVSVALGDLEGMLHIPTGALTIIDHTDIGYQDAKDRWRRAALSEGLRSHAEKRRLW